MRLIRKEKKMGLLIEDLKAITKLQEKEIKEKLIAVMKNESHNDYYEKERALYNSCGLGKTYPDDNMGFISHILGDNPTNLAELMK